LRQNIKTQCCVKLSVQPSRGLMDEKFIVLVQNVWPGFQLTVHALHQCEDGHSWEAFGHYTADATGTVNGSQSGWNPQTSSRQMRKMNVQTPMEVTISVYQGHQTEGFVDQVSLAGVLVERWYMAPGVHRIPITEGGLTATLFLPPGPGPFPGLLDLWGGTGDLLEYRAALLASHGIASLALDYLTPKISMEAGETAYRVLQQHPQVLGSRIAMLGLSFGCSVTLKMAAYSHVLKVRQVLFIILTYEEKEVIWRNLLLPIPTDPSQSGRDCELFLLFVSEQVGRLQCPLLLVVGEDDQNWPAYESAMDMKEMMERAGNSHLLTILWYPNAGHLIEPPYTPLVRASTFKPAQSPETVDGGTFSCSQEDAWRKTLVFLRENLKRMKVLLF
uniref:Acyl-CoA thioesterase 19 n=1 Tax=Lates calcarifer TaxID=8187 RepID=A0A4W6DBN9_LATCA